MPAPFFRLTGECVIRLLPRPPGCPVFTFSPLARPLGPGGLRGLSGLVGDTAKWTGLSLSTVVDLYAHASRVWTPAPADPIAFCAKLIELEAAAREVVFGPDLAFPSFETFCRALLRSLKPRPMLNLADYNGLGMRAMAAMLQHSSTIELVTPVNPPHPRHQETPWQLLKAGRRRKSRPR